MACTIILYSGTFSRSNNFAFFTDRSLSAKILAAKISRHLHLGSKQHTNEKWAGLGRGGYHENFNCEHPRTVNPRKFLSFQLYGTTYVFIGQKGIFAS